VQVDPIKPMLKAPGMERLKLKYDVMLSSFAFNSNLRRYSMDDIIADVSVSHLCDGTKEVYNLTGQIQAFELKQVGLKIVKGRIELNGLTNDTAGHPPHLAGASLRASTRPTFHMVYLLRASAQAFTLQVSHTPISVKCLFSMTLRPGVERHSGWRSYIEH